MSEKEFEDIICKYPELIEEGLVLKGRQIRVFGKIMDILFEDKFKQKLIVELKIGPINRKHIGQVMEYEGSVLSEEDPTARIMLVGNRVPPNFKKALDHHGIEWKEIILSKLQEFIKSKCDNQFLEYFTETEKEEIQVTLSQREKTVVRIKDKPLDKYKIDWRNPESHLALINNKDTLNRVNYLRNKIKQIGSDVEESGRQKWMKYLVNGRLFANVGEFRKNGDFWVYVNFYYKDVHLGGYEVKSWGTTKWAIIKLGHATPFADLDKFLEWVKKSYQKNRIRPEH